MTVIPSTSAPHLTLPQAKAAVTSKIHDRLDALQHMLESVASDTHLSDVQRTKLHDELQHDVEQLNDLETKVQGETKVSNVWADKPASLGLHVLGFERSKVKLEEHLAAQGARLDRLQARLAAEQQQGTNPNLDAASQALANARAALDGQADALLGTDASQYTPTVLQRFRDAAALAQPNLKVARQLLTQA